MSCGFTRFTRDAEAMSFEIMSFEILPFEILPVGTVFVETGGVL
jgi:hypothetical protein